MKIVCSWMNKKNANGKLGDLKNYHIATTYLWDNMQDLEWISKHWSRKQRKMKSEFKRVIRHIRKMFLDDENNKVNADVYFHSMLSPLLII